MLIDTSPTGAPCESLARRARSCTAIFWSNSATPAPPRRAPGRVYSRVCRAEPVHSVSHHWAVGDLVLWDNRCTLHARTEFSHSERTVSW